MQRAYRAGFIRRIIYTSLEAHLCGFYVGPRPAKVIAKCKSATIPEYPHQHSSHYAAGREVKRGL